jgi:hypothetical protein
VENTQRKQQAPPKPKRNQRLLETESNKIKTFASQKKLLNEYYNWDVVFPATTIHQNSILYRDDAQNQSYRNKLKIMSEKMATMGGRGQLGNDFGGSTKELSPRKMKSVTLDTKLTKSEISLNLIKDADSAKVSSSLLNMIGIPFNWKSRMLSNRVEANQQQKKKTNLLTNFWRKRRNEVGILCNER